MTTEEAHAFHTVECWLTQDSARMLSQNGFRWHVARPFETRDGGTSQRVWRSMAIAPRNAVSWDTAYALSWTFGPIDDDGGDAISINGPWQECLPGDVYDLDTCGYWARSAVRPRPGHMTVGVNRFLDEDEAGVHIVIGQRSRSGGGWEPIFVDSVQLGTNMSAWYKPTERVEWWFENGVTGSLRRTATLHGSRTPVEAIDMSYPQDIGYCATTYDYKRGVWTTSTDPPPQSLTNDPPPEEAASGQGNGMNGVNGTNGVHAAPKHRHQHPIRSKGQAS